MKMPRIKSYKHISLYILPFVFLLIIIYLSIPFFFNYAQVSENIRLKFENHFNLKIKVTSKIKYKIFPSPRLILKKVSVEDLNSSKQELATIDSIVFKIPLYNLINTKKIKLSNLTIYKADIKLNYDKIFEYINFLKNNSYFKPIVIQKSKITLLYKNEIVTTVKNINFKYISNEVFDSIKMNGLFLDDKINIKYKNEKLQEDPQQLINFKLKDFGLGAKINILNKDGIPKNKKINLDVDYLNNSFFGNVNYQDDIIYIYRSKISNPYYNGNILGEIKLKPHLLFDLAVDLNYLNFKKIYNYIVSLDQKSQRDFFKINKKINGNLTLDINKISSPSNLFNAAESLIKLKNGDIFFDKLIFNIKNIGAVDIVGLIANNKKSSKFSFNKTINIDNLNKFKSKFAIKQKLDGHQIIYVDGILDLKNYKINLEKIETEDLQFPDTEIKFIESAANSILLEEKYFSFFNFDNLVLFVNEILEK